MEGGLRYSIGSKRTRPSFEHRKTLSYEAHRFISDVDKDSGFKVEVDDRKFDSVFVAAG